VKEETESADLSQIHTKFDDKVLLNVCAQHESIITKEPFTHESLLIDKKEYQLSEREKNQAFREYQNDKKYFPYNRSTPYNLYYQRFPSNTNQLIQNQINYSAHYSFSPAPAIPSHGSRFMPQQSTGNSNSNFILNQTLHMASGFKKIETNTLDENIKNSLYDPSLENKPTLLRDDSAYQQKINYNSETCSTQKTENSQHYLNASPSVHNLKDVKITSFVSTSQIVIPTSENDPERSITIQPGEKVFILKTPKGVYMRTPDKKYIALRDKSLEDSFMPPESNIPSTSQQANTNMFEMQKPNDLSSNFC
jgi:hypothetical protein